MRRGRFQWRDDMADGDPRLTDPRGPRPGLSRRDFLASSFLAGTTAGLFAGPVGAGSRPLPRPKLEIVFEEGVFSDDVFA